MAITVPAVTNRTVQTDRAPNQFQSDAGATPEAFGALEGRALQQGGNVIQQGAGLLNEAAERQKAEDDARNVLATTNDLKDRQRKFQYGEDGNGGEFSRQGSDALGGQQRTADFYKQTTAELSAKLTDPKQRLAFDRVVSAQRDADLDTVSRRAADERVKAATTVASVTLANATRAAVDVANDDKTADVNLNLGLAAIRSNITKQPQEAVEAAAVQFRSDLQTQRIARVAVDSPAEAEKMYERLKPQISGGDHAKVERLLEPLRARREGLSVATEYLGQPGPATRQVAAVAMSTAAPLVRAVIGQESSGNPNAVSSKGAAGVMQVMPDTAREISAKRGDGLIPANATDEQVRTILKDPSVGQAYGTDYLRTQLQRFGGDVPTALVAYNAGPAVAERWLKERKGPNDLSTLPAETQAYVPKVMSRLADAQGGGPADVGGKPDVFNQVRMGALPKPGEKFTAEKWPLKFYKPDDMLAPTPGGRQVDARAATMADALGQQFFEATGIRVPINDTTPGPGSAGKRRGASDPEDNPHVENSQHLHGRAFDFQVQNLSEAQKAQFLQIARSVGFSGVGFYEGKSGHLHLDTGKARSWGAMPKWAGGAMAVPALGASDVAVAPSLNGLPLPPSMRAAAGGAETGPRRAVSGGASGTGTSFLPPALSPEGRDLIGTPTPTVSSVAAGAAFGPGASGGMVPPAVSSAIRLADDLDPQALRDAVANDPRLLEKPAAMATAKAAVEREIRAREGQRKSALRDLRSEAIRHVQSGGASDDLSPEIYSALTDLDPKFVTDTLPAMEDRIRKRKDKTDPEAYHSLATMDDDKLADLDLTSWRSRLSQADYEKFSDRQKTAAKATASDAMKWDGIQGQTAIATNALKAAGIFPDKDDAEANRRAGLFMSRLDMARAAFQQENKREMKPAEFQEAIGHLMTPINGGDWTGKTQYLFEQGTSSENEFRRRNELPLIGTTGNVAPAQKLEQIPAPALQTLVDNFTAMRGTQPKADEAMRLFNDSVALETGRQPKPDGPTRTEIIASLRRRFGASIQTDASRSAELEAKVQDVYSRTLRSLFTPKPAASASAPAIPF